MGLASEVPDDVQIFGGHHHDDGFLLWMVLVHLGRHDHVPGCICAVPTTNTRVNSFPRFSNDRADQDRLLFLGLIIGSLVSELFFSGALSDRIVLKAAKANNGIRTAESRLWLAYPAVLLTSGKITK